MQPPRCHWVTADPLYISYHDNEWGEPTRDDRDLFELLILEGAQAGLSWITVLRKREAYCQAYDNFDIDIVAAYTQADTDRLLANAGIIRNRAKIAASITNAKLTRDIQHEYGSFSKFLWDYVHNEPITSHLADGSVVPVTTPLAEQISNNLKKRGFKFVGPTITYSYLQSAGLVNDHLVTCFKHPDFANQPH